MTIDPADLAEARRLAEEANEIAPGRWTWEWKLPSNRSPRWLYADTRPGEPRFDYVAKALLDAIRGIDPSIAAFIAHCNPAFVLELVREIERLREVEALANLEVVAELRRLRRVEEAARDFLATEYPAGTSHPADCEADRLSAALANPAAEAGE